MKFVCFYVSLSVSCSLILSKANETGLAEKRDACISCVCIIPNFYALPKHTVFCMWLEECVYVWNRVCQFPPVHHWASEECEERSRDEDWKTCKGRVVFAISQSRFSLCPLFLSAVVCQCASLGSSMAARQQGWVSLGFYWYYLSHQYKHTG